MNRILVVDDDTTITLEFEEYLPTIGYQVVGVATTGTEAIKLAVRLKPDIVLMDIRMPGKMDGIQAAASIKAIGPEIIFVSGHSDEELLERAKLVRPLGFLHKPFSEAQITATLKIAFHQLHEVGHDPQTAGLMSSLAEDLSVSEMRIAKLLRDGKSTGDISTILNTSPSTVIWHRKNIRKKLNIAGSPKNLQKTLLFIERDR